MAEDTKTDRHPYLHGQSLRRALPPHHGDSLHESKAERDARVAREAAETPEPAKD